MVATLIPVAVITELVRCYLAEFDHGSLAVLDVIALYRSVLTYF